MPVVLKPTNASHRKSEFFTSFVRFLESFRPQSSAIEAVQVLANILWCHVRRFVHNAKSPNLLLIIYSRKVRVTVFTFFFVSYSGIKFNLYLNSSTMTCVYNDMRVYTLSTVTANFKFNLYVIPFRQWRPFLVSYDHLCWSYSCMCRFSDQF